jgi:hypothetical protein
LALRFFHRPVTSFEDATHNFEQLEGVLPGPFTVGVGTLAWTAANLSANLTVAHGLPHAPRVVVATALSAPAAGNVPALNTFTYTATQFSINGDVRTAGTFTCQFCWVAIG